MGQGWVVSGFWFSLENDAIKCRAVKNHCQMSPTLLYLGLPWLTGTLDFSIQGVTTVIVVFIPTLGPIHGEEMCPTRDSICQGHRKQIRLGSKVQTLVYSDEDRRSHKGKSGSATSSPDTIDTQQHIYWFVRYTGYIWEVHAYGQMHKQTNTHTGIRQAYTLQRHEQD